MKKKIQTLLSKNQATKHFATDQFWNYSWISIFISVLNIFLLWLFIDIFDIHTILAGVIVVGGTFILRYFMFRGKGIL